jgi:Putative transposase DNA-binding domain
VTVLALGSQHTALLDGSGLCWALLSPAHERSGYRVLALDRVQGCAAIPHYAFTAQSRLMSRHCHHDRSSRPSSLALCSPPSRRGLARLMLVARPQRRPALTAAARSAWAGSRSGRRNGLGRTKNKGEEEARCLCYVGDVSPKKLGQDTDGEVHAGWSMLRNMLSYKSIATGGVMRVVPERYSFQTCSVCGCIPASSPKGLGALGVRQWRCDECGTLHDRDINGARNIEIAGAERRPR